INVILTSQRPNSSLPQVETITEDYNQSKCRFVEAVPTDACRRGEGKEIFLLLTYPSKFELNKDNHNRYADGDRRKPRRFQQYKKSY
ncbi:hypothetical protein STEG23_018316, partial [Scotinomys teguina]